MMELYSSATCPFSHRCRFVLCEKGGMDYEIKEVDLFNKPEEISAMNPYGQVPILVERDLILYESNIINEYIDERFPHPQLMPADPQTRAKARLMLFNLEKLFFRHVDTLENDRSENAAVAQEKACIEIRENLMMLSRPLQRSKYLMGDELTMPDVALAPLLWRLQHYGIELPKSAAAVEKYAQIVFSRPAFIESLTAQEKIMRR
jgi:RNA polymerase-associated protein